MLVAIFWQRLPIQIVVADWVADSRTVIIVTRVQIIIYAPGSPSGAQNQNYISDISNRNHKL